MDTKTGTGKVRCSNRKGCTGEGLIKTSIGAFCSIPCIHDHQGWPDCRTEGTICSICREIEALRAGAPSHV